MNQGMTVLIEENNNEKIRFCTSWRLGHRCEVITSGAVTIDIFLPDVEGEFGVGQPVCGGGMAGNGWWGAGAGWGDLVVC